MSYSKKTWSNGDDVTPADFNRIETGIEDNANKINILTSSGFGKNIVNLGNNVDILSLDKNIRAVCESTINHPAILSGGYCFVYNIYLDYNWQEVYIVDFATGLKYRNLRKAGIWQGWEPCSAKKNDISSFLVNGWTVTGTDYSQLICRQGNIISIDCLLINAAQANASTIIASNLPIKPNKNTILKGYSNLDTQVHFVFYTDGTISLDGVVPSHAWIKITDTVVM